MKSSVPQTMPHTMHHGVLLISYEEPGKRNRALRGLGRHSLTPTLHTGALFHAVHHRLMLPRHMHLHGLVLHHHGLVLHHHHRLVLHHHHRLFVHHYRVFFFYSSSCFGWVDFSPPP